MADLTFLTKDHPEAHGRTPLPGEEKYLLTFPVEHDRVIEIQMGSQGYIALKEMILSMTAADDPGIIF